MTTADYVLAVDPGLRGCGVAFGIRGELVKASYVVGNSDKRAHRASLWVPMALAVTAWNSGFSLFALNRYRSTHKDVWFLSAGELVIECPQVYKASHQVGHKVHVDPMDIVDLAACVGAIVTQLAYPATKVYLPKEWKGQVPKEICHARAIKALSQAELQIVNEGLPIESLAHNTLDAVALFLKHVGRVV